MTPDLVLLDRDGTIIEPAVDARYVTSAADVRLLAGVASAIRDLNLAGAAVVVVTNQRGIATGELTNAQVERVHERIREQLSEAGAHVDGWYVCPHDVGQCDCRKPLPGLLAQALADRPAAVASRCVVIGDSESDVLAGRSLGISGILLGPDFPAGTADTVAVARHASLRDAVTWLLRGDAGRRVGHVG
jgi:D-glycero-D-manno-heptose 1,7-bisphosphate phosphatase